MAIEQFGESLLADVRKRNDDLYKKQKKEAYKIALMQTGVKLINNSLQTKAANFLASEEAMAARAKQRRGVDDAQFFIDMRDAIEAEGVTAEEYFENQMMPIAVEKAKEAFREENFDPDSYNTYIRKQVQTLAKQRTEAFNNGIQAAEGLSSPEDFEAFQILQTSKQKSAFNWVASSIGNLFTGKSRAEVDRETIDAISNSDQVTKAGTVTALRRAFSQTGDINIAQEVAAAVEEGRIKGAETRISLKAVDTVTAKGPFGEDVHYRVIDATDANGNILESFMQPLSGVDSRIPTALSNVVDSLSPGEQSTMADTFVAVNSIASDLEQERFDKFISQFSINEKGEADPSITMKRIAAQAKLARVNHGIEQQDAEAVMSRIFLNRITDATTGLDSIAPNKFDFTQFNLSEDPNPVEYVRALGDLEGTAYAVNFDWNQLDSMINGISDDFASYDSASREAILKDFSNESRYSFLHAANPLGETVYDILQEINERQNAPKEDQENDPLNDLLRTVQQTSKGNVYVGRVERN